MGRAGDGVGGLFILRMRPRDIYRPRQTSHRTPTQIPHTYIHPYTQYGPSIDYDDWNCETLTAQCVNSIKQIDGADDNEKGGHFILYYHVLYFFSFYPSLFFFYFFFSFHCYSNGSRKLNLKRKQRSENRTAAESTVTVNKLCEQPQSSGASSIFAPVSIKYYSYYRVCRRLPRLLRRKYKKKEIAVTGRIFVMFRPNACLKIIFIDRQVPSHY